MALEFADHTIGAGFVATMSPALRPSKLDPAGAVARGLSF